VGDTKIRRPREVGHILRMGHERIHEKSSTWEILQC
jgi:hypothetical protein